MKKTITTLLCAAFPLASAVADPAEAARKDNAPSAQDVAEKLKKHAEGARRLADAQDELSADVQDLNDEQTDPKLKKLLTELEGIMADATDRLESTKTGGATIAIETEVIEKIFEAAKQKQQQSGGQGQQQQGMLEMMRNMMQGGKDVGAGQQPGGGKGKGAGNGGGEGDGNEGTGGKSGDPDNTAENGERRVPKSSGNTGSSLPREFHKAMDAYNKAASKKAAKSK